MYAQRMTRARGSRSAHGAQLAALGIASTVVGTGSKIYMTVVRPRVGIGDQCAGGTLIPEGAAASA